MVYVDFLKNSDSKLIGVRIADHAEYADEGYDIVCASVSSAFYLVANAITDVQFIKPYSLRDEYGEAFLRVYDKDADACAVLLKGLEIHLLNISEQYPENVNVHYIEVRETELN